MKRILLEDIQQIRILDLIKWTCRVMFAFGFGIVVALTSLYIRFAQATKHEDASCQYSVIRLTGENEELRLAIAELTKKNPEAPKGKKK